MKDLTAWYLGSLSTDLYFSTGLRSTLSSLLLCFEFDSTSRRLTTLGSSSEESLKVKKGMSRYENTYIL